MACYRHMSDKSVVEHYVDVRMLTLWVYSLKLFLIYSLPHGGYSFYR